ncbi:unnamed protein product [Caenorhabditis bovis]|uniref:Fatty acid hydroxylase domain-containing protein n=1 Tax=Caenorhabditis bovis TaxID=2654633 RepID=A0A8S1EK62_9PELO|nr:unnamed protein product [Caenorhabditis bovis]
MLHNWYPVQNYTAAELEYERDHRLLQPVWEWIKNGNEHILRSPLFPPIYALSIDYTWVITFSIIDIFFADVPFFKKHKIQKDRKVTWSLMKKSLQLQLWNQLLWIYPMALVQLVWVPDTELPILAPTVFEMLSQIAIFFLSFDFTYFWFHYICHKLFFVGSFITTVPWIFKTHCLTYWVWFFVAQSVSYEVHIGYDFPFALHRFFWFYSGAPAHDMHHLRPLTCFQPWFNYLDRIMGYHITYEHLKKMTAQKLQRYGLYNAEDEKGLEKHN